MSQFQGPAVALAIAIAASPAFAQQAQAPAPSQAASATKDCTKRHDHGAERQMPSSRKDCEPASKKDAGGSAKKQATTQGHDHGKVHKNQ